MGEEERQQMAPGDSLWASGWILNSSDPYFIPSNWNGLMHNINQTEFHPRSTEIKFLPIIEGDPNDRNTIYTTLKNCLNQSHGEVMLITFDFPIWVRAIEIIIQEDLPIVPRLGGFHLLKSYLFHWQHNG